jgi:DNA-binding XRE family transcriptional regulator
VTDFGSELRRLRESCGLTQEDVGKAVGWSGDNMGQTVSHYETGRRVPNLENAVALMRVVGGSLDRIYGLEDPPERRSGRERRATPGSEKP